MSEQKSYIDFHHVCNNDPPDTEVLKNEMKAHCICIKTLDGKFAISVGAHYLPSPVSRSEQREQSVTSFEVLNTCLCDGECKSECPDCEKTPTENKRVSGHCQDVGHIVRFWSHRFVLVIMVKNV